MLTELIDLFPPVGRPWRASGPLDRAAYRGSQGQKQPLCRYVLSQTVQWRRVKISGNPAKREPKGNKEPLSVGSWSS